MHLMLAGLEENMRMEEALLTCGNSQNSIHQQAHIYGWQFSCTQTTLDQTHESHGKLRLCSTIRWNPKSSARALTDAEEGCEKHYHHGNRSKGLQQQTG